LSTLGPDESASETDFCGTLMGEAEPSTWTETVSSAALISRTFARLYGSDVTVLVEVRLRSVARSWGSSTSSSSQTSQPGLRSSISSATSCFFFSSTSLPAVASTPPCATAASPASAASCL
jgi:hypothetical protein